MLFDNKLIVVVYDYKWGEKEVGRVKFNKREDCVIIGKGDCIDCF